MRACRHKSPSGITLLECLLAAVILAMTVSAIIMPFAVGAKSAAQDARVTLSIALAQDLMEEIISKSFHDPDETDEGETGRSTWDDMADYDGYFEQAGQITSLDGTLVDEPSSAGLTRRATVQEVYVSGQDTSKAPTFYRVSVEVCYFGSTVVKLSRLVYANE